MMEEVTVSQIKHMYRSGARLLLRIPETVMYHAECTRRIFVIVGKTLREEELHHGRPGIRFHPHKRCQSVPVYTHHYLCNDRYNVS